MKLDGSASVRDFCALLFLEDGDGVVTCTEQTIQQQMDSTYSYYIGYPKLTISKPLVEINTCSTQCTITDNSPSHSWWTEATDFEIQTNDQSILGTASSQTFTDVTI